MMSISVGEPQSRRGAGRGPRQLARDSARPSPGRCARRAAMALEEGLACGGVAAYYGTGDEERGATMSGKTYRCASLVRTHGRELVSRPGIVGVGVGRDAGGKECLVVLVDAESSPRGRRLLPGRLQKVPSVVIETGVVKTLVNPPCE